MWEHSKTIFVVLTMILSYEMLSVEARAPIASLW